MDYQFESLGPTLRIVVLVFLLVFAVLILGAVVAIASLPGSIAKHRSHPQAEAIRICGWVGLPSGILWAIAIVWAYMRPTQSASSPSAIHGESWTPQMEAKLNRLEQAVTRLEESLNTERS